MRGYGRRGSAYDPNDPDTWTVNELRAELRHRNKSVRGLRRSLVSRMRNVLTTHPHDSWSSNNHRYSEPQSHNQWTLTRRDAGFEPVVVKAVEASEIKDMKMDESRSVEWEERSSLVLWRRPIVTLQYFFVQLYFTVGQWLTDTWRYRRLVACSLVAIFVALSLCQQYLQPLRDLAFVSLYWMGLGILSSVGLGTGLHTFILYLGPFIAKVTLAAQECGSLNFPSPPYPDEIICPPYPDPTPVTIWQIISKVRLEAMMWGAGTALGELPPYFIARASRLAGRDAEEVEIRELEELRNRREGNLTFVEKTKLMVQTLIEKVGFFGILACASVPNPLFDLAGITCGHFLVPFWTFFGATLIGKAVFKMHLQKLFVIFAFNETLIQQAVSFLGQIPLIGPLLQSPFKTFLQKQKQSLRRRSNIPVDDSNILSWIFEKIVIVMFLYFIASIINSMAQSCHKRLCKKRREE